MFPIPWPGSRLIPLLRSLLVTYRRVRVEALDFCASHSSCSTTCGIQLPISGLVELVRPGTLDLSSPPCAWFPHIRCDANVEPPSPPFFSLDRNLRYLSDADEAPIEDVGAVRHYYHQFRSLAIGPSNSFFFFGQLEKKKIIMRQAASYMHARSQYVQNRTLNYCVICRIV